jgi:hypothetical protein
MLEEKMRMIVRENRPIEEMEMIARSARDLLKKWGSPASADSLLDLDPKGLVSLVKIGSFYELMDGPFCPSIRDVGAFKVVSLIHLGEREYQVEGCAFATKVELKEYLKRLATYKTENHLVIGQRLGFWDSGEEFIWRPKGIEVKNNLISFFKESLGGCEHSASTKESLKKFGLKQKSPFKSWSISSSGGFPKEGEGLLEEGSQSTVEQNIYCSSQEFDELLISLLQTIDKTLIILGFHVHVRLAARKRTEKAIKTLEAALGEDLPLAVDGRPGARAQWFVADGLKREQLAIEIEIVDDKTSIETKVSVEKILALLLELSGGRLPKQIQSSCANVNTNSV